MHFIGGIFNSLHAEDQCQSAASMQMTITCGEEPWTGAGGGGGEGGESRDKTARDNIYSPL